MMSKIALAPGQNWRYDAALPADRSELAKAFKLLETYSHIPADQVEDHVKSVRDKAFAIHHYPCLGRWRFLQMYITDSPLYPIIISRLRSGDSLLDVGCCFGQILRQLAADGAPPEHLAGIDLRPDFIDLGYELFQDCDTFAARFVTGDVLDPKNESLKSLDGQFDIIHAASFFHLFDWDDQVAAAERIVRFLKPATVSRSIILGRQVGTDSPLSLEEYREKLAADALERRRYLHNATSFQKLWDDVGERTSTKWVVEGSLTEIDLDDGATPRLVFKYAVHGSQV